MRIQPFQHLLQQCAKAREIERLCLRDMGEQVAAQLRTQHPELTTREEKVQKLSELMEQLGYAASSTAGTDRVPTIEADNCIFHHLAVRNPDVCQFDLALMSSFTDSEIAHQECMAKNGNVCRFKLHAKGGRS